MKQRINTYAAGLCLLLLGFSSCGEDRTPEFQEKTKENQWIEDTMDKYYLWYEHMPSVSRDKYFAEPKSFFESILYSNDKYSYFESLEDADTRSINQASSYGFDFALYVDPVTGSSSSIRRYARVLYVLPNSPASEVGLKRGDWISTVGGEELTSKNYPYLINGPAITITTTALEYDKETEELFWEEESEFELTASRKVEDNPFYVDSVYHEKGKRIAYLMYNRFTTGPNDSGEETVYRNEMRTIFSRFKSEQPTDFILDLRYNPGGYLTCAQDLASLLAPQSALGDVFCTLKFNDKMTDQNVIYNLENSLTGGNNLNLSKLYVITSDNTASASESIINCLRPYMGDENIIIIGTKTEGKNVASLSFESPYSFILHPIVATVYNKNNESDYSNGIEPTHELNDLQYIDRLKPLGDSYEIMLYSTIHYILYGYMPKEGEGEEENENEQTQVHSRSFTKKKLRTLPVLPEYNSIERKKVEAIRIN